MSRRRFWRRHGGDIGLLGPALVILVIFVAGPILSLFGISLTRWTIIGTPEWIGIRNFQRMADDGVFLIALRNTLVYSVILVPIITAFSLGLAVFLNAGMRGSTAFKAIFVVPIVAGIVITSNIWKGMLTAFGPVNQLLDRVGLDTVNFFGPELAVATVSGTLVWRNAGYYALFFLAGMQSIDRSLYDAAAVDGARGREVFRHITWPLLMPITLLVVVLTTIGSFQIFSAVYILTGGGPANASLPLLNYIYDTGWRHFEMGYAAAQALVFFVLLFCLSLGQRWLLRGGER